jgi:hypothetical protein
MGRRFAIDLPKQGAKPYVLDVIQEDLDALKGELVPFKSKRPGMI